MVITKEYIQENLIDINGGLKCRILNKVDKTPEELYLIYHGIEKPVCENNRGCFFKSFIKGYGETCDIRECNCSNRLRTRKRNETISLDIDYYKKLVIKTKETKLKRYGSENYCNAEAQKITLRNKITNSEDYNEKFVRDNFINQDIFEIFEMCDYFNIQRHRASVKKHEFNITQRNRRKSNCIEDVISKSLNINDIRNKEIICPFELDLYSK